MRIRTVTGQLSAVGRCDLTTRVHEILIPDVTTVLSRVIALRSLHVRPTLDTTCIGGSGSRYGSGDHQHRQFSPH